MCSARWSSEITSELVTMLKMEEPNWNRASLGCCEAPLKNGSSISRIPVNGIHRADHHWTHWSSAIGAIFTRAVFPFAAKGAKT